jgi:hypothetical protein
MINRQLLAKTLTERVWPSSPELKLVRAHVAAVRADYERARLLRNPSLDPSHEGRFWLRC